MLVNDVDTVEGRLLASVEPEPDPPRLCNLACIRFGIVFAEAGTAMVGVDVPILVAMLGEVIDRDVIPE